MSEAHVHATHPALVSRLKRAEGHLRHVIAMIEQGKPCTDIATQLHAVERAVIAAKRTLNHWLFAGTVIGFIGSAALVLVAGLPGRRQQSPRPFVERLTRGTCIYLATPRLRGLLSLNLAATASGAFVIVNTVVIVRAGYGGSDTDVACGRYIAVAWLANRCIDG